MAKTNLLFVDTSGFYALLAKGDSAHQAASAVLLECQRFGKTAVTTDYVIDETATLLKARGFASLLPPFFTMLKGSIALKVHWIGEELFERAKIFFLKHSDHRYSFTDCTSFTVMRELGVAEALTKDSDFALAGFKPLLGADSSYKK